MELLSTEDVFRVGANELGYRFGLKLLGGNWHGFIELPKGYETLTRTYFRDCVYADFDDCVSKVKRLAAKHGGITL